MNLKKLEALLKVLKENDVSHFRQKTFLSSMEISLGGSGDNLIVERSRPVSPPPQALVPSPPAAPESSPVEKDEGLIEVSSPMVGTFYRSPSPDDPAFVKVGDEVKSGSVLCIVEAMKLMNEIESEVSGTIVEILVDNAQPVQFEQPLFKIKPN